MKTSILILSAVALIITHLRAPAEDYKADFGAALDDGWSFVREDKEDWRLVDGRLELLSQPSNIWGSANQGTQNILLRALPGAKSSVEVILDFTPVKEYEQAGLILYVDDDNYIKFDRELYGGQSCTLVLESAAQPKIVKKIPFPAGPMLLRLDIADGKVTAMVKAPDAKDWTAHGETTLPGKVDTVKVGLFALNGDPKAPLWAKFSEFIVRSEK